MAPEKGRIAVVGHPDAINYFRVLGCEPYYTEDGTLTPEQKAEMKKGNYTIMFVTTEVFENHAEIIRRRVEFDFPVVCIIPEVRRAKRTKEGLQSKGYGFKEIRDIVIKAVGSDIATMGRK